MVKVNEESTKGTAGGDIKTLTCLTYQNKWLQGDTTAPSNYLGEGKQLLKPNSNARTHTDYTNWP